MELVYSQYQPDLIINDNIRDNVILMKNPDKQDFKKAKDEFGKDIVETVIEMVQMSDPNTAYCLFDDLDMPHHIVALENLYYGT